MRDLFLAGALGDLEIQQIENVLAPGDRAARQTAGEDLGQGRQVGADAISLLRPARRDAEAGHHLVEDQHASVPDEVKRTRSAEGISRITASAQRISSSWLAPKWVPRSSWACTAAMTSGRQWPSNIAPCPPK